MHFVQVFPMFCVEGQRFRRAKEPLEAIAIEHCGDDKVGRVEAAHVTTTMHAASRGALPKRFHLLSSDRNRSPLARNYVEDYVLIVSKR